MAEDLSSSRAVNQVMALCEEHLLDRKVVFVPYAQLGQTLTTAVARQMGSVGGLECQTPRSYAKRLGAGPGAFEDQSHLGEDARTLLVQSLLRRAKENTPQEPVQIGRLAPQVSDAIETLRLGRISPEEVRDQASPGQGVLPLLAQTYRYYEGALEDHALYDDADLFASAARIVEAGGGQQNTVFAIFGETELHESGLGLMHALRRSGRAFYSLGAGSFDSDSEGSSSPETTAASLLSQDLEGMREPERAPGFSDDGETVRFRRAVGPLREVRAALRDVLRSDRRLDEVEIAYTASRPYLTLFADEAERLGLPFTLGTGLPLTATRPGQALSGFYEWIENGFDAPVLIRLLRSGLLQVDRWAESSDAATQILDERSITRHQVARVLASHRYGPGPEKYSTALETAVEAAENERGPESGEPLYVVKATNALVEELMSLLPESGIACGMAAGSLKFMSLFGPSIRRSADGEDVMVTEESKTTEEIADAVLRQQVLEEMQALPFEAGQPLPQVARFLRTVIQERYVGAQNATSGAVHVLPLDSAGFSGRDHLYVVGMDSETASAPSVDAAVLSSSEREAFETTTSGALPKLRNAPSESAWRFEQAVRRHEGNTMLVATTFDPDDGEPRHPSTLYLRKQSEAEAEDRRDGEDGEEKKPPIEGLARWHSDDSEKGSPDILLSESESWLAAVPTGFSSDTEGDSSTEEEAPEGSPSETAWDLLSSKYPWLRDGNKARLERQKKKYTIYDGLLKTNDAPELDFLNPDDYQGPPISAGRLEMLAESPYAYFLKYVLGVEPLEEPALDEEPWLNPRRKGSILHRSFEEFMRGREDLQEEDRTDLFETIEKETEKEAKRVHPGTDANLQSAIRELKTCGHLFFQCELHRAGRIAPLRHEWGFGYREKRQQEGDIGPFELQLKDGTLPVRGRIDRVDRLQNGKLAVWDYKTGSRSSFSEEEPLKHGEKIQWALYALVLEQHRDEEVAESGYFFTSEKEMGTRLSFEITTEVRQRMADTVAHLAELARTGSFPLNPRAHRNSPWRWGDWDRLFRDLKKRVEPLPEDASLFEGKARPHFLGDPDE